MLPQRRGMEHFSSCQWISTLVGPRVIPNIRSVLVLGILVLPMCGRAAAPKNRSARACPAPNADSSHWVHHLTTDSSLEVMAPEGFIKDGRNNLWASRRSANRRWFRLDRGHRAVIRRSDTIIVVSTFEWIPAGDTSIKGADFIYVSDHSACREAVNGVAALVEAGLLSGGIGGMTGIPAVRVQWELQSGQLVELHGEAYDRAGQEELLSIARTVRILRD